MNRLLACIAFPLLTASTAAAQRQSIGIQAGLWWTKVNIYVYGDRHDEAPRVNLGFNYERFVGKRVSLGADLLFQQRGLTDFVTVFDRNGQSAGSLLVAFRYNYLALPLKAGYTFGKRGFGFGKLGIVPALLLKARTSTPGIHYGRTSSYDITSDCNRFDLGGIAEAGGGFHFNTAFQLFGSLACQQSITRFTSDNIPGISELHYGWNLNFGLRYELPARPAVPSVPTSN